MRCHAYRGEVAVFQSRGKQYGLNAYGASTAYARVVKCLAARYCPRAMILLGIETSCDETAAAVVTAERRILSDVGPEMRLSYVAVATEAVFWRT